jgi:hypothetical protein
MRKSVLARVIGMVLLCGVAGMAIAEGKAEAVKAEQGKTEQAKISIRKVGDRTVLYTLYRGPYEKIGSSIGQLYATAGKSGIAPRGNLTLVYLNNAGYTSPEHYLTEIRIPVDKDALKLAGTLGPMTDVKNLRAVEMAVLDKAAGDMDYPGIYARLYTWIGKNGHYPVDSAEESFFGAASQDVEKMKSEVSVPVGRVAEKQAGN